MPIISLLGHQYNYTLVRKPITSIRLRLQSHRSFIISAPYLVPEILINHFIQNHSDWIVKHSPKKISHKFPSFLTILDQKYQIIINKTPRDSTVIFPNEQKIYLNSHLSSSSHLKKLLNYKLRPLALKLIRLHLSEINLKYNRLSIRNQSSRFGSCSSKNNLSFNWQIILFPNNIFRHILIHEICHTVHHNHSVKFWSLVASLDRDYRAHRRWLKSEANKFMIFS